MEQIYQKAVELSFKKLNSTLPNYKRFLFDKLKSSNSKIIGIYGSRGVGKTTLILQYLKELKNKMLYISMDHPIFENISLFEFVEYAENYGIGVIAIDEIHFYRNFERDLKSIYDFLNIKVIFSGSSALKLTNASFARRYAMFHLPILSFREFLELKFNIFLPSFNLDEIFNNIECSQEILSLIDFKILPEFKNFLKEGVYPFYFQDKESYYDKIIRTVNTILYEDLILLDIDYKKIDSIKKLILNICFSKPLEINIEKLASAASITKVSLYKYLDILEKAELINRVMHSQKRFSNIRKPDKLYLSNTNLLYSLYNPEIGQIRETFFVSNVKTINDIYFFSKGDFLIPLKEEIIVEIGGKSKTFKQIKDIPNSYLILDDIEIGSKRIIPLWLFGFLY